MSIGGWRVQQRPRRTAQKKKEKKKGMPEGYPLSSLSEQQQSSMDAGITALGTNTAEAKNNLDWIQKVMADTVLDKHTKAAKKSGQTAKVKK